jgi:hypothetical protein
MSVIIIFFLNRFLVYIGEWKRWDWIYISPRHIFIVHEVFLIRFKFGWDLSWYPANTSRSCISNERRICHWSKTLIWKGMFQYDNGRRPIFRLSLNICVRKRKCFLMRYFLCWHGNSVLLFQPVTTIFPYLFQSYYLSVPAPAHTNLCGQTRRNLLFCWLSVCLSKKIWLNRYNKQTCLANTPTAYIFFIRTPNR